VWETALAYKSKLQGGRVHPKEFRLELGPRYEGSHTPCTGGADTRGGDLEAARHFKCMWKMKIGLRADASKLTAEAARW